MFSSQVTADSGAADAFVLLFIAVLRRVRVVSEERA